MEPDDGELVGTEGWHKRTQDEGGVQSADRSLPVVVEAARPLSSRATVCLCVQVHGQRPSEANALWAH